ncbi:Zinc finger protein [Tolypocladium capitatum]|uniref:Zinc finger protein n=1 Tax=Tolypocladium capitatum TaxID=45235 RepID=A0A2K3QMK4_9HYPO|nr:Zinc finger protein [Tolypocladium capitatum]
MSSAAPPRLGDDKAASPASPAGSGHALNGHGHSPARFSGSATAATLTHRGFDSPGREQNDASSNSDEPAKKRRRGRKDRGKRFECPAQGCGKSYSRAEHLYVAMTVPDGMSNASPCQKLTGYSYRHQLNHNSKQVFRCEYPDCPRTFVRGDLLKRHMDRHALKGPQLGRRDSIAGHLAQTAAPDAMAPEAHRQDRSGSPSTALSSTPPAVHPNGTPSAGAAEGHGHEAAFEHHGPHSLPHTPSAGPPRPPVQATFDPYSSFPHPGAGQPGLHHGHHDVASHPPAPFVPQQNVNPMHLPPAQYRHAQSEEAPIGPVQAYAATASTEYSDSTHRQSAEMMALDQMAMSGTGPVFGDDGALNKSPYIGMPEDFMAYLFNSLPNTGSPAGQTLPTPSSKYAIADDSLDQCWTLANGMMHSYGDLQGRQYAAAYLGSENTSMGYFPAAPQQIMAVNNLLDQNAPEASISEEKSEQLFDLIKDRFHENDVPPVERRRDSIIGGDRTDSNHMLSRRMMQAYISSYWYHFSDQMPILHKPTFCSDKTPNLLLLAMMAIGAACLDRAHGQQVIKAGAKMSHFLARHLRWEIFMDWNFRPPAKLWVFQALILLELYEKMYSTRELHERAHIHHATTITLMRRGRSLIGKCPLDSPPGNPREQNGSHHASAGGAARMPDEWWSHWITSEATRRAAFAAFIVDTTHATMFGHSGVMAAHELRLALPCDESLWRATSSAEVARVESNLSSQGIKPMSFLEGLKRTLGHQEVPTTSFGRTVLMAGLLSVTYHMHQRDLQVNILGGGVMHALGGRDKWRATLTRAYDSWKADFDKALAQREPSSDPYRHDAAKHEVNIVFASRTVLHHLAHMAMHADIVDCQIFARARRLLGRSIGPQELRGAERRIREFWAHTARARDATYYALKFLRSVLLPGTDGASHAQWHGLDKPYEARHDELMNRPWVLYFAALIVWCYGFALEGPCTETVRATAPHEAQHEMRNYLVRYGGIADPNELYSTRGVNNNTALLMVLKDSFEKTRWDLLHEAANLLRNCIMLNAGGTDA